MADYKVIICDMDNTLCESCCKISLEMAEKIDSLVKKGFEFAVIGGSDVHEIQSQVCSLVKEPIHVLGTSGTKYYKFNGENIEKKYELTLSKEEIKKITDAFDKLIEKYNIIPETSKEDQILMRGSQITLSAIGRHADENRKRAFDHDKSKRKQWVEFLKPLLSEFTLVIGGSTSIDITKGFNKGIGIRKFAEFNKFKLSEILFIGDGIFPGGNDYSVVGVVDYIKVNNEKETLEKFKEMAK